MAHKHVVYDADPHFSINASTRAIENKSGKVVIMQYDHNSECFTFEIPKTIDGHDMTQCNLVEVHYDNIDSSTKEKYSDVEELTDLQVSADDETKAVFSWTISGNATQYKGQLNFSISFQCVENGVVEYEWGTAIHYGITIGERQRNSNTVVERSSDILATWKGDLFGIGDTEEAKMLAVSQEQQSAISAEGDKQVDFVAAKGAAVLASIPDDYESVAALADENARIKAGAIVLGAEGESIVANDSANAYLQGLKIFGKTEQVTTKGDNIFPQQYVEIVGSGQVDLDATYPAGTYTFSAVVKSTDTDSDICAVMFNLNGEHVDTMFIGRSSGTERIVYTGNVIGAFDRISFYAADSWGNSVGDTITCTDVMLNVGETPLPYEPYTGGKPSPSPEYPQELASVENPTISVFGSNLVQPQKTNVTQAGVTITRTADGNYTVNGTRTSSLWVELGRAFLVAGEAYALSADERLNVQIWDLVENKTLTGKANGTAKKTFTPNSTGLHAICLTGSADLMDYDNILANIMINAGDTALPWEPYGSQEMSFSHTLPGIPVESGGNYTDSNGQQWVCDEIDFEHGVYIQRVKSVVFDGSHLLVPYTFNGSNGVAIYEVLDNSYSRTNGYCTHSVIALYSYHETPCMWIGVGNSGLYWVGILDALGTSDVNDVNTYIRAQHEAGTPVTVLYPTNTPIETPLSDSEIAAFRALKTNKPTTTITNDQIAFMTVDYVADTKTYIDNKIAEMVASITSA